MLTYNGKEYARVSEILQPFVDFGSIEKDVLERKAALGTRVHHAIEQEIKGELPIVGFQEKGYFKSFELWRAALKPIFLETEQRIYCDQKMITGCVDALVKLQGEEKAVLIDWKTSAAESPIVWPMQAHLYNYLLAQSGRDLARRFLFIKLDRYGNLPKVFQYKFDPSLMGRCLQAIDSYWEQKKTEKCCD